MLPSMSLRRLGIGAGAVIALVSTMLLGPSASAATADEYVALGDSYSSGNGTFAANLDWFCYKSTYAYPYLVAQQRANTSLMFAACQGAQTSDIINGQNYWLTAETDYVTITIGGNDIGFADLIISCGTGSASSCDSAIADANDKIKNELPANLDKAYAAIKKGAPNVRKVVVLGYARFFGPNTSCSAASLSNPDKYDELNGVADNLDAAIRGRATAAGFTYQSSITTFTGHDVCASTPYLNGWSWSVADGWHPTRAGHASGLAPLVRQVIG